MPRLGHLVQVDIGQDWACHVGGQLLVPRPSLDRRDLGGLDGQGQADGVGDHGFMIGIRSRRTQSAELGTEVATIK